MARTARWEHEHPHAGVDYSWYQEHRDRRGRQRRRWEYLSCGFGQHNGAWPVITIEREAFADRVGRLLGLPTVALESEEFNRTFAVRCEPGVDHDLDGNVVASHENPWGPGRTLPGRE